jgi:hypothetical protein
MHVVVDLGWGLSSSDPAIHSSATAGHVPTAAVRTAYASWGMHAKGMRPSRGCRVQTRRAVDDGRTPAVAYLCRARRRRRLTAGRPVPQPVVAARVESFCSDVLSHSIRLRGLHPAAACSVALIFHVRTYALLETCACAEIDGDVDLLREGDMIGGEEERDGDRSFKGRTRGPAGRTVAVVRCSCVVEGVTAYVWLCEERVCC